MASKKEYPEIGELVLCTVKEILKTIVFVDLDNYHKTGVVTTAEIAPGRIRNIRDYVVPNKRIACKVLRIDEARGHIDLSFRRVSLKDRIKLMEDFKRERSSLAILEKIIGDKSKVKALSEKIKERYESLFSLLELAKENPKLFEEFEISEKESKQLVDLIQEKIKIKKIIVKAKIKIKNVQSVEDIKSALETDDEKTSITYISAPSYLISIEGTDYKEANKKLQDLIESITKKIEKIGGKFESEIEKMS